MEARRAPGGMGRRIATRARHGSWLLRWDDMEATKTETESIRAYAEGQVEEAVGHLEKAASEMVGPYATTSGTCTAPTHVGGSSPTRRCSTAKPTSRAATLYSLSTSGSRFGFCTSRSDGYPSPRSQRYFFPGPGGAGSRRSRRTTAGIVGRELPGGRRSATGVPSAFIGEKCSDDLVADRKAPPERETSRTGRNYSRTVSQPAGARTSCGPTSRSWPWRPGNT